jgi:hypothetical protein
MSARGREFLRSGQRKQVPRKWVQLLLPGSTLLSHYHTGTLAISTHTFWKRSKLLCASPSHVPDVPIREHTLSLFTC